jgi:ABC-2 type transport system ATP-binding protein
MSEPIIILNNLRRTFNTFVALHDLTLTLQPGCIGLLGPNGAGKSTLLKLLMGLIPPSSGTGVVLGQQLGGDRDSSSLWQLRRLVGFMPEAEALVPGLTGIEYISLAGELCGMPRRHALRRGHEVLSYLQLEEARYRRVEEYSVGMKQRVKLAQALIHDPPLLLLDEPTSGLDPSGRDVMLKLIRELSREQNKSIILSTHLLADVQTVCEQVVIMAGGRLRNVGTVEQLCASRKNRYRLRVQGDVETFLAQLRTHGVEVLEHTLTGEWRICVTADWSNWQFFECANQTHAVIRAVLSDDETLEELFLRTIQAA